MISDLKSNLQEELMQCLPNLNCMCSTKIVLFVSQLFCSNGTQVLFQIKHLDFGIPDFEPYFASLSFYDIKRGVKVTEDFHFDLNPDSVLAPQLQDIRKTADQVSLLHNFFH
jgi:hypothetical protein